MIAHTLRKYFQGGLQGLQYSQRDCSPFLVHFTSWTAMNSIRQTVNTASPQRPVQDASWVNAQFELADAASFEILKLIVSSGRIRASHPQGDHKVPPCACLSECNLPSLLSLAERYGRFGLVFDKEDIYALGGRPCAYLSAEHRTLIYESLLDAQNSGSPKSSDWGKLFSLCHVYRPVAIGGRVQDFTHEREWRLFSDIDVRACPPRALLVPGSHVSQVRGLWPSIDQLISIDDLLDWGA